MKNDLSLWHYQLVVRTSGALLSRAELDEMKRRHDARKAAKHGKA